MSILSKMLLREMVVPFFFSFCILNALLLLGHLLSFLEPLLVGQILPLTFPDILVARLAYGHVIKRVAGIFASIQG